MDSQYGRRAWKNADVLMIWRCSSSNGRMLRTVMKANTSAVETMTRMRSETTSSADLRLEEACSRPDRKRSERSGRQENISMSTVDLRAIALVVPTHSSPLTS